MERRLLVAVVLSIIVMLAYPLFLAKVSPPVQPTEQELVPQPYYNREVTNKEVIETQDIMPEKESPEVKLPAHAISKRLSTERYELIVSNIGGSVQGVKIKDGRRFDIDLVDEAIYQSGILAVEGKGPLAEFSSQEFSFSSDKGSFYAEKNGLLVQKSIRFLKDKYALSASLKITNRTDSPHFLNFEITTASNISSTEVYEARYIGADVLYTNGKFKRIASGNFKKINKLYQNDTVWLALKNKYYSIIAKPAFTPGGVFTRNRHGQPVAGFFVEDERIMPGETKAYDFLLYIGPTELNELRHADPSFDKALNFGIFTSIGLVLLGILKFFFGLFHNYGVSILLLTCCISFVLFPLSLKSLKSMRKLQELQPHIEKVRAQHKDNPQKLNKEIMEIYRRYNVNPMGGCLPMFLQMPIFIALYQTLMRSVELKGASFLWIKDLSMPDAAFHLPFTLPLFGSAINLLPILMIGAMILQQKLSQMKTGAAQSEQQKMMGSIMPVMFGFIFYSLPAGLVLYWLTNTLLTSSLQYLALRKA